MTTSLNIDHGIDSRTVKKLKSAVEKIKNKLKTPDTKLEIKIGVADQGFETTFELSQNDLFITDSFTSKDLPYLEKRLAEQVEHFLQGLELQNNSDTLPVNLKYYAHVLKQKEL